MKASFLKPSVVLNCLLINTAKTYVCPLSLHSSMIAYYGAKFSYTLDWPSSQLKASSITLFIQYISFFITNSRYVIKITKPSGNHPRHTFHWVQHLHLGLLQFCCLLQVHDGILLSLHLKRRCQEAKNCFFHFQRVESAF